MSRTYFDGWFSGAHVKAEDWYKDNLVYVNVCIYTKSTVTARPDIEKSFLLHLDEPDRISEYKHSISEYLIGLNERRDNNGHLIPLTLRLPQQMKTLSEILPQYGN